MTDVACRAGYSDPSWAPDFTWFYLLIRLRDISKRLSSTKNTNYM